MTTPIIMKSIQGKRMPARVYRQGEESQGRCKLI